MGGLPEGWAWAELGQIASSVKNGMYVSRPGAEPNGMPILRIGAVRPMRLSLTDLRYTGLDWQEVLDQAGEAVPGDLLFTRYNGNPEYVGAGARVPEGAPQLAYPDKLIRVRVPSNLVDSRFLSYAWASPQVREQVRGQVKTSAGQAGISGASLKRIKVPLPPLAEQHRIVEAIEEQLSRLDQGLSSLGQNEIRARKLIPRVMSAVFDRSGGELKRVDEVGEVRLGRQRSPKNHHGDNMHPYLRAANVGWSGLLLDDVKEMNFSAKEMEVYRLHVGDILISEASGSPGEVGKPALWTDEIEDCCFQNTLIRVRPKKILPEYLHMYFRCLALRGDFRAGSRGVGIHHLGAAKLAEWSVIVPSEEMQRKLVDSLEETVSALEAASKVFDKDQGLPRRAYALRNALLRKAFNGDLVPQDPADEPAAILLARIAAEREAAKPARKAAKRAARPRKATAAAATKVAPAPTPAPSASVQQELFVQ